MEWSILRWPNSRVLIAACFKDGTIPSSLGRAQVAEHTLIMGHGLTGTLPEIAGLSMQLASVQFQQDYYVPPIQEATSKCTLKFRFITTDLNVVMTKSFFTLTVIHDASNSTSKYAFE
eukprot:6226762-Amphidinium_carterae.1